MTAVPRSARDGGWAGGHLQIWLSEYPCYAGSKVLHHSNGTYSVFQTLNQRERKKDRDRQTTKKDKGRKEAEIRVKEKNKRFRGMSMILWYSEEQFLGAI